MGIKFFFINILLVFLVTQARSQDCTLGIGGKDKDVIIQVFQLNEAQITKLETWGGELKIKTKLKEDELKQLLSEHPQSTQEDLFLLAKKYKNIEQEIIDISLSYDKKLLAIFNERQYSRYMDLCKEASRSPLRVEREVVPE